jgi:HK97 family phage major capsid protein
VVAEWKAEAVEAADATPGIDDVSIPMHMGSAWVPYSVEIEQDGLEFGQELSKLLMDAADSLQAQAFTTGTGTGQPTGFVTALAGTASEVAPGTPETFLAADVFAMQNALPARFQANAQWLAALPTINTIAQMVNGVDALTFPEVRDGMLLRRPLQECSNMQSTDDVDAGETATNYILAYGDWQNFVIADRIGSMIEIVPQVFGTNHRPTGQRGAWLWFRTGSDVVVDYAIRLLNVETAVS